MKRILITGKDSYIGTSVEKWLLKTPEKSQVDTLDVKGEEWMNHDFSKYDVVFHVAGIAHVSTDPKMEDLYYKVNRDLTIEIAKVSKDSGVKQFIFMSSIIVYGNKVKNGIIYKDTVPNPSNFYGKSKLEAEEGINKLASDSFKVLILRPPMIYGKGSKGNYQKLSKLARITPIFPDFDNKRSMLHIDNLCEFIKVVIDYEESGLFFPQNKEYVKTSEMFKLIAEVNGRKLIMIKAFNSLITLFMKLDLVKKVFGSYVYDKEMSRHNEFSYSLHSFQKSIELTELE